MRKWLAFGKVRPSHGKWGWGQDSGDESRKKELILRFGYQTDHKAGPAGKGEEATRQDRDNGQAWGGGVAGL